MISTGHAWDYRGEGLGVEFTLHGNTAKVVEGGYPPVYKEHLEEACARQLGGWEGSLPCVIALEVGAGSVNRPTHLYRVAGTSPDVRVRSAWDKAVGKQTAELLSRALDDSVSTLGLAVRRGGMLSRCAGS